MADRKAQIEMLIAAKADVQKQLDVIFSEECDNLILSATCLSQIDPESMAQFLAHTIYECFNSHDEVTRSMVIERFSSAFGAMVEGTSLAGMVENGVEGGKLLSQNEKRATADAAWVHMHRTLQKEL